MENLNYDWMKVLDYEELRTIRRKYWTFVIWPDENYDLNDAWLRQEWRKKLYEALSGMVIPSLISPIHDKDVKEDGTIAKPHCHVISLWENPQRYNLVLSILNQGCGLQNVKYVHLEISYNRPFPLLQRVVNLPGSVQRFTAAWYTCVKIAAHHKAALP